MNKKLTKTTEFEGYMGGDGECFCLEKEKLHFDFSQMTDEEISEAMRKEDEARLYPSKFFPDECHPLTEEAGKFKFKIIVEATPINELQSTTDSLLNAGAKFQRERKDLPPSKTKQTGKKP